jgi:hypothetical protein
MMKKLVTHFLTILLLLIYVSPAAAQTGGKSGDWNTLGSQLNNEVAVKAGNRKTVFGILTNADAGEIKVRISANNNVSEVLFKREEVEKIWLAKLDASSRKTLLGAGIGAAVGASIGLIALKGSDGDGGGFGAAVPVYAVVGAVVGGVAGFFVRQKNKKERLIYQK